MDTTETEIASTTIKHREPPPLNVYVRIRPFISDELERGENQQLIDILDEKHIAVKLYPTINNTIRTLQTSYNEYEVFFISEMLNLQSIFLRSLEYLIIVVINKNYSNKFSNNQQMKFLLVQIGFFVHLV
jgi:hypothetical protein